MKTSGALLASATLIVAALLLLSGGGEADPQTPAGLPGKPPPFLGVAVLGDGGLTAAVDAYGDVVDLRPDPAGPALIENPAGRQAAGTVEEETGIQPWVRLGDEELPIWRADEVRQRYLPGTNVLRTEARFGRERVRILAAAHEGRLAIVPVGPNASRVRLQVNGGGRRVTDSAALLSIAEASDRRWLARARPLAPAAPAWAKEMYERSLLVLRALTDRESGAVAAGARDGWAYVWPRDAAAVAIAYAEAGYRPKAELTTQFLLGLGLEFAARFHGDGSPVPGRDAQGDAIGWVAAASKAAGIVGSARQAAHILAGGGPIPWRDRADYWEGEPGNYLGNALASTIGGPETDLYRSKSARRLVRRPGDPESGVDSAAAWGVRPFPHLRLYPAIRRSMTSLVSQGTRFGILPGEAWPGGEDPWSAPTAWTAWSLAALGERREARALMAGLRRAATPAGDLPERVDAETGIPRSTTPLAWSHAFAILALRKLWP
jgi:glucoamylase